MSKELEEKIYSMSNSFLPLDVFYNDIRDNPIENYNKEQAYKDIEIIADFIIDLQTQLDQQKAMWNEMKEWIDNNINSMSDSANYRQKEQLKFVKQKMQELEGEKDD